MQIPRDLAALDGFFKKLLKKKRPNVEDFRRTLELMDIMEAKENGKTARKQEQAEGTKPPTGFRNEYDGIDPGAA